MLKLAWSYLALVVNYENTTFIADVGNGYFQFQRLP
jgi:hypothetical protein